jgi:hypothetical protein
MYPHSELPAWLSSEINARASFNLKRITLASYYQFIGGRRGVRYVNISVRVGQPLYYCYLSILNRASEYVGKEYSCSKNS